MWVDPENIVMRWVISCDPETIVMRRVISGTLKRVGGLGVTPSAQWPGLCFGHMYDYFFLVHYCG